MLQGTGQVGVDLVRGQFGDIPVDATGQDVVLAQVSRATSDSGAVSGCEFSESHGTPFGEAMPAGGGFYPSRARSSIGYGTDRLYAILRTAYIAALIAAVFAKKMGMICLLICLGELPVFIRWFMDGRRMRRSQRRG